MPKIRTLSRYFMPGHPKKGEPTLFLEKALNSLGVNYKHTSIASYLVDLNPGKSGEIASLLFDSNIDYKCEESKRHTIRMGRHFKPVDQLTLTVWSGKPYRSKIIKLWTGEIRAVDIEIKSGLFAKNSLLIENESGPIELGVLARNDGLSLIDFRSWFHLKPGIHEAQILIWNPEINY